jgi:CheY-like chemotaxis protein
MIYQVIVADDQEFWREHIGDFLAREDVFVDGVGSADDLIEVVRTGKYDLLITDNQMKDGYENSGIHATSVIRGFNQELPIILHSSFVGGIEALALEAGVNEVFEKGSATPLYLKQIELKYLPIVI